MTLQLNCPNDISFEKLESQDLVQLSHYFIFFKLSGLEAIDHSESETLHSGYRAAFTDRIRCFPPPPVSRSAGFHLFLTEPLVQKLDIFLNEYSSAFNSRSQSLLNVHLLHFFQFSFYKDKKTTRKCLSLYVKSYS